MSKGEREEKSFTFSLLNAGFRQPRKGHCHLPVSEFQLGTRMSSTGIGEWWAGSMRESRIRVGVENRTKFDLRHGESDLQDLNAEREKRERKKRKGR